MFRSFPVHCGFGMLILYYYVKRGGRSMQVQTARKRPRVIHGVSLLTDHDIVTIPSEERPIVMETPRFYRWSSAATSPPGPPPMTATFMLASLLLTASVGDATASPVRTRTRPAAAAPRPTSERRAGCRREAGVSEGLRSRHGDCAVHSTGGFRLYRGRGTPPPL